MKDLFSEAGRLAEAHAHFEGFVEVVFKKGWQRLQVTQDGYGALPVSKDVTAR